MINPSDKPCWVACASCHRCYDKGRWGSRCVECSGRHDPNLRIYPDRDDVCECRNGILRWKTQTGRRIIAKFDPSTGNVIEEKKTQDEADYNAYLKEQREKRDDEHWDPIQVTES